MDLDEASPLILTNLHGYLRERDAVLTSVSVAGGERSSAKEELLIGGRVLADVAQLFQPGGCVSGHVISFAGDGGSAMVELEGGTVGRTVIGMQLHIIEICKSLRGRTKKKAIIKQLL
jgi:hypothetical protein